MQNLIDTLSAEIFILSFFKCNIKFFRILPYLDLVSWSNSCFLLPSGRHSRELYVKHAQAIWLNWNQ